MGDDAVLGRYEDGLERLRDLEMRSQRGEVIAPAVLLSEVRAIRDDMVAERRSWLGHLNKIEKRMDEFLPRRPWVYVATIGVTVLVGVAITVIGSVILGGPS